MAQILIIGPPVSYDGMRFDYIRIKHQSSVGYRTNINPGSSIVVALKISLLILRESNNSIVGGQISHSVRYRIS